MNYVCEYMECTTDATWLINNPPSWAKYACDDHLGAIILDDFDSMIEVEVTPVQDNPRVYQKPKQW